MKNQRKSMLIIFLLFLSSIVSACTWPGLGGSFSKESIVLTSGSSTEMQIAGFIVEGMIEHYLGVKPELVGNLGTSTMNHQAVTQGDANVSAIRYTGTDLTGALQMDPIKDPQKTFDTVVKEFSNRFDQKYFPSYGFANTYAFMVTQETAEKYDLEKVSDLETIADQLRAGADTSWIERKGDGYQAFLQEYGFDFQRVFPMQIGLVYDALEAGEMDIVLGYSTDGRIASYDLKVLEDDRHLFPPYDASPLATEAILKEYPDLEKVLLKLQDTISTELMQKMNFISDDGLVEPKVVAKEFLEDNAFFEDKEPYLEPAEEKGGDLNARY